MKNFLLLALVGTAASAVFAQETPEKAVDSLNKSIEAAYAKGDVNTLTAMFTDDAQFTSEDGSVAVGKSAIGSVFTSVFSANPGLQLSIETRSVRTIAPGVLVVNGFTTSTPKSGETDSSQFTAVWVQKDGKWKLSEVVETPLPDVTAGDHLEELGWLVGKWQENDPTNDVTVSSEYSWARGGGNFLTRNVTVKRGNNPAMEGWQVIGWDPVQEQIRSWTFDSEGGYSDGFWTRAGDRWLVREAGYAPDGSRNSAEITISKLGPDKFTYESNNRTLDGEPQPSIDRIEIARAKGN